MQLIGICTADSYDIKSLFDSLKKIYLPELIRDTIHVKISEGDAFIFPYGVIIFWGASPETQLSFIEQIRPWEIDRITPFETDEFEVIEDSPPKVQNDTITLPNFDTLTKLAVSHGVAQSLELSYFETVVKRTYQATRSIPADLMKYGRISLSRKEIRRKMGELFQERSSINLHADALDLPEFFWEHSHLEPTYQMIAGYLDIRSRAEVLNHRLDIMHDLYEVLAGELNHQHSSRLELTIIILIVIEVILVVLRDVFNII